MGYTIKQKIEICLKLEANPQMTQKDLATWVMKNFCSNKPPAQTTILRILSSKNEILGAKDSEFQLVRRRKVSNPLLRRILTEWITQALWEKIPVTTPIIQLTANAIWTRLPPNTKKGNGVFNHKWCNNFVKKLNVNLSGSTHAIEENLGYPLNRVWQLDEKVELKQYVAKLIEDMNYRPQDLFSIDEFLLLYNLPLDQIFDVSFIDKGLDQNRITPEHTLTIMLGCNMDGSEKLRPLVVAKQNASDIGASSHLVFKARTTAPLTPAALTNKICDLYQISYKHNDNKWITLSIFQNYLLLLDHKISSESPNRNILIFLDNSSSHRIINLKFKHIKLIYMVNASKHKIPYGGSFKGMKFDYIPMSYGVVDEFKILFRLQQYLEMINKQRNHVNNVANASIITQNLNSEALLSSLPEILSESDYQVPFIKAIEWVRRSWDSISQAKIFMAWQQTYIINLKKPWPSSDPQIRDEALALSALYFEVLQTFNPQESYNKLKEIIGHLNVVIPWEIEDLVGLVNERSKVNLNYVSIDEIIGSCYLSSLVDNNDLIEALLIYEPTSSIDAPSNSWFNESSAVANPSLARPKLNTNFTPLQQNTLIMDPLSTSQLTFLPRPVRPSALSPLNPVPLVTEQNVKFNNSLEEFSSGNPAAVSLNALLLASETANQNQYMGGLGTPSVSGRELFPPVFSRPEFGLLQHRKHWLKFDNVLANKKRRRGSNVLPSDQNNLFNGSTAPLQNAEISQYFSSVGTSRYNFPSLTKGFCKLADAPENNDGNADEELACTLSRVIEASKSNGIKLLNLALEELKYNLLLIQRKYKG